MNEPSFSGALPRAALDERRYLESLAAAALEAGLVGPGFLQGLRLRLLALLELLCNKYTGGASSSLPQETAQELSESALVALGAWLKGFEQPPQALKALAAADLAEGWRLGCRRLEAQLRSAKSFYSVVLHGRIRVGNECYDSTLLGGIPGFFRLYDPLFGAHRLHITADYPVCFWPEGWQGVEFIRLYLQNFKYENDFMALFPPQRLQRCLSFYAACCGEPLPLLNANLYLIALAAALACLAAGTPPRELRCAGAGKAPLLRALAGGPETLLPLLGRLCGLAGQGGVSAGLQAYLQSTCAAHRTDLANIALLLAEPG